VAKDTDQTPAVTLCYEAGYDGFWLARYLEKRGVTCQVMEPASLQVNRRARRVKTDRIDAPGYGLKNYWDDAKNNNFGWENRWKT
jgi:transposase